MRRLTTLIGALGLTLLPAVQAADVVTDERVAAYQEFRTAFDAGSYTAALPLAAHVVEMTRSQYGPEAVEMANPLSNLATTYYRMRNFGAALDSYREALRLLDLLGDATNPRLVRPLHGTGVALHALERDDEAIAPLKRAVDITRNRDGLHAVAQLPMLKALIDCYMSTGRYEDAGREQQYAFNIAEIAYGRKDLRLLKPIDDYARWNESVGRYSAARALHAHAAQIADDADPTGLAAIDALRGIARTFRLAFINGETESAVASATEVPSLFGSAVQPPVVSGPAAEGERALRSALQRLGAKPEERRAQRGAVLIELGDWYVTAGTASRAIATYKDAWRELEAAGDVRSLLQPEVVVYRPPSMATSRKQEDPDQFTAENVELHINIAADGSVRGVTVANAAPEREAAEKAVSGAIRRSAWRPAFQNGEAVMVPDALFRERVYIRRPKPAS